MSPLLIAIGALCVAGHPAPRDPGVSYGGLAPRHGYVRDHIVPLCLGGGDGADNMQYQTFEDGRAKDEREWRACEDYCAGRVTLEGARRQFERIR